MWELAWIEEPLIQVSYVHSSWVNEYTRSLVVPPPLSSLFSIVKSVRNRNINLNKMEIFHFYILKIYDIKQLVVYKYIS